MSKRNPTVRSNKDVASSVNFAEQQFNYGPVPLEADDAEEGQRASNKEAARVENQPLEYEQLDNQSPQIIPDTVLLADASNDSRPAKAPTKTTSKRIHRQDNPIPKLVRGRDFDKSAEKILIGAKRRLDAEIIAISAYPSYAARCTLSNRVVWEAVAFEKDMRAKAGLDDDIGKQTIFVTQATYLFYVILEFNAEDEVIETVNH